MMMMMITSILFLTLLLFLDLNSYTDHVRIPLNSTMELFEAADLFMIPRLKTICEKRMLQSISVMNAASIFYGKSCVKRRGCCIAGVDGCVCVCFPHVCHSGFLETVKQRRICIRPPPCGKK